MEMIIITIITKNKIRNYFKFFLIQNEFLIGLELYSQKSDTYSSK